MLAQRLSQIISSGIRKTQSLKTWMMTQAQKLATKLAWRGSGKDMPECGEMWMLNKIQRELKAKKGTKMHKKIMEQCSSKLKKDASHYAKEAKGMKGKAKAHEKREEKEAKSASKEMKKRAKAAHE